VAKDEHQPAALQLLDETRARGAGRAGREEERRDRYRRRGGDSA
jgi:hypothetical protein